MSEIEIFKNPEFGELRTVEEGNNIYFVASDVAKALGYAKPGNAVAAHCRYTLKRGIPHPQGKGSLQVNIIPEGDVYRLVAHSELPSAEKFESWVFDEVLPTIRKTGGYIAGADNMTEAEIMARAVLIGQRTIEEQQKRILELKPKADYADKILASSDLVTTTAIAKDYGMSAQQLNNLLKGLKILFKRSGQWFLYAKYQNAGYTSSDTISFTHKNGKPGSVMHTKWTQKGRKFLYDKLKEIEILPMIERKGD